MEVGTSLECGTKSVCKVGTVMSSPCSKTCLTTKKDFFIIKEKLNAEQFQLLTWRTGFQNYDDDDTICSHHFYYYVTFFEQRQKSCCDPFRKHQRPITNKKDLRQISLEKAKHYREKKNINLIPGQLLCNNCRKMLSKNDEVRENEVNAESNEDSDEDNNLDLELVTRLTEKEKLNESLVKIDVTPLKLQSVASHSKKTYAKRKLKQAKSQIKKKLSFVLKVDEEENNDTSSDSDQKKKNEERKKINDMDRLVELMKEKLNSNLSLREKIQVLTIAPQSWSRKRVADEFNVSEYMVRRARKLTVENGIFAIPGPREGHKILAEVVESIKQFYEDDEDDEYSMMMPGAKDRISIRKNEYKQKRLLLCNLEELYFSFKQKFPDKKIGFSTFCSLRPKWCVLAGAPGTHAVCVCVIHQNVYLLATALNLHHKEGVHQLVDKLVCSRDNRACMLRCCPNCPNSEPLKSFLNAVLEDYDDDEEIQFSQWVNEGRMKLQTMALPVNEFIELITKKIEVLIPHSYITKTQNTYLKSRKENLKDDECLVLMDFAENYSFILQNEVQSYHWSHSSCSLHPTVIYSKSSNGTLKETALCVISDDLNHDVPFVYCVQKITSDFIKAQFTNINKVEYITDGCSAQYKNYKTMLNLCQHKTDFGLDACWSFHATSHGKTVCDGIGGTVKRTVTKKNLQSVHQPTQITNANQMYMFCKGLFSKISFFYLKEEEINLYREKLEERFSKGKTITGTRSFHFFSPIATDEITAKRTSMDPDICLRWNFVKGTESCTHQAVKPSLQNYVACVYEGNWWIGLVSEINKEEGDFTIRFMHPPGPSATFYWPSRQDECPVPPNHILCVIENPDVASHLGRNYKIDIKSRHKIEENWNIFKRNC